MRMLTSRLMQGSPPRVRGTVFHIRIVVRIPRITPACAGNREGVLSWTNDGKDHPRVCGEQVLGMTLARRMVGSPPRVRGTVPI